MSSQTGRRCIIKTIPCREGSEAGFSSISGTIPSYYPFYLNYKAPVAVSPYVEVSFMLMIFGY